MAEVDGDPSSVVGAWGWMGVGRENEFVTSPDNRPNSGFGEEMAYLPGGPPGGGRGAPHAGQDRPQVCTIESNHRG